MEHPLDTLARALAEKQSRRAVLRQLVVALAGAGAAAVLPGGRRAAAAVVCAPGLVSCGGSCVDLLTSAGNCGSCGRSVGPAGRCQNGQVVAGTTVPPPATSGAASNPPGVAPPITLPPNIIAPEPPAQPDECAGKARLGESCSQAVPCCEASQGLFGQNGAQTCTQLGICVCNKPAGFSFCSFHGLSAQCCPPGKGCCEGRCFTEDECCNGERCVPPTEMCVNGQCICTNTGKRKCGPDSLGETFCCPPGTECAGDHCTCTVNGQPGGKDCEGANAANCCAPGHACCPGNSPIDGEITTACCPVGATCGYTSDGARGCICADGNPACGFFGNQPVCCGADQTCCLDVCKPKGTQTCFGENNSLVCCAPATECCQKITPNGIQSALCCKTLAGEHCDKATGQCVGGCTATTGAHPCTTAGTCCAGGTCLPTAQCPSPNQGCCTNGICGCDRCQTCQAGQCVPCAATQQCCDADGRCQPGTTDFACGPIGGTCVGCGVNATCVNRTCTGICDAERCPNGCCQNGACQPGTTTLACGTGGGACTACTAGQSCQNHTCTGGTGVCNCTGAAGQALTCGSGTSYFCGAAALPAPACFQGTCQCFKTFPGGTPLCARGVADFNCSFFPSTEFPACGTNGACASGFTCVVNPCGTQDPTKPSGCALPPTCIPNSNRCF